MAVDWKRFLSLRRTKEDQVHSPRRGFNPGASGIYVYEDSAMQVAAFHRGLTYLATQIAKLPWDVKDKKNNILSEDRVSYLLNMMPNNEMNALSFRLAVVYNAIVHGNFYAEIERDLAGRPIALWPLRSQAIDPYRDPDGNFWFRYTGITTGNQVLLHPSNVFHIPSPHMKDGIIGQSLIAYAERTLGISLAADRMASNLFANGGLPSGILRHKGKLSDVAYKRLKDNWSQQYGKGASGGTAILEEDTDFKTLEIDAEMLQFLESRKFGVLEIARFLGLPPTKLFDTSAATYSNVENANLEVATDTLDYWARRLEIEADVKLLNGGYGGKYTELDLYQVFRGDMSARATYYSKMMQLGALTPNQIREREGLAPYAGGDEYYIATNNYTPASMVKQVVEAQIKSGTTKQQKSNDSGDKSQDDRDDKLENNANELEKAAIEFLRK